MNAFASLRLRWFSESQRTLRAVLAILAVFALSGLQPDTVLAQAEIEFPAMTTTANEALEPGRIIGKVISAESGEPLPFANLNIFRVESVSPDTVEAPAGGTFAMEDGSYRLDVPQPGTYRILATFIGYRKMNIREIEVAAGEVKTMDIPLSSSALSIDIGTVEVTAERLENTSAFVINARKNAGNVSDGISSDEIKKTTDSNAAEALQRVTGLSVVGGQYVYVRGLGERYSQTQVNGSAVASPETNKKVMPMDMFSASVLDNMVVEKTYAPDKPAEFAGGLVNLTTRDFPGQKTWSLSIGTGYNSLTTGEGFRTYSGGGTDFLGFDDGTREIPDIVPDGRISVRGPFDPPGTGHSAEEVEAFGEAFNQEWSVEESDLNLPGSFGGSFGNEVTLFGNPLGFLGSLNYSNGFQTTTGEENTLNSESLSPNKLFHDVETSTISTEWAALSSLSYRLNAANRISLRTMYNRSAEDILQTWEGEDSEAGSDVKKTRFQYIERGIFNGSLEFKHHLVPIFNSNLDWKLSYANARREEPDRRTFKYEDTVGNGDFLLTTRSTAAVRREFGRLNEDTRSGEINWSVPFRQWAGLEARLKVGAMASTKDRSFDYRRYGFRTPQGNVIDRSLPLDELLTPENIGADNFHFQLINETRSTDEYRASHDLTAQYAMVDVPLTTKLRMVTGVRVEQSDQNVQARDLYDPDSVTVGRIDVTDVAPAVNLVYRVRDGLNFRAAWSSTVNRPDLRELSPFSYTPDGDETTQATGNPDLDRATIRNYDLRAEYFLGLEELIAISGFYKDLQKPIEMSVYALAAGGRGERPINARDGYIYGMELESRLAMSRLSPALHNFVVNSNLTLVKSETDYSDLEGSNPVDPTPPLVGQSPYVMNAGLFFRSTPGDTEASITFNVFGERLQAVGLAVTPSIYERPRHTVDFSIAHRLSDYKIKFNAENITDQESVWEYDSDDFEGISEIVDRGVSFAFFISTGS